MPLRELVH